MKKGIFPTLGLLLLVLLAPIGLWVWEAAGSRPAGAGRLGVQSFLSPFVRAASRLTRGMSDTLEYMVRSGQIRRESVLLQEEATRLRAENGFLREALSKYRRLDSAAALAELNRWRTLPADVVAYGGSPWTRSLVVNRGARDGVEIGDPVLHIEGLAGVVVRVTPGSATVQLLNDPGTVIGAVVPAAGARGVVTGLGQPEYLEITLEDPGIPLRTGQRVMSSGLRNSLYPRGLPLGEIGALRENRFGQSVARVRPLVSFRHIQDVLILKTGRRTASDEAEDPGAVVPLPAFRLAPDSAAPWRGILPLFSDFLTSSPRTGATP